MAQKLFIGSLSFNTTSERLSEFFAQAGTVQSAQVVTDQYSGRSRGFGFVEMSTSEEAERAVAELNGRELDGRALRVEVSKPKTAGARESGYGAGRGASGGGRGGWR
ncbi:MAG TPA: RNA-binding protein [Methylomirabilota bacterium]|jgi:RNA recognition motif-containing protein|nr:RNA-binding protein [Methylomirabilota bacterium]